MDGARLERQGDAVRFWQYDALCEELDIFCKRFADQHDDTDRSLVFTPELFETIRSINTGVNRKITPKTDLELYSVIEKWTIPDDAGDCEDYALLKMLRLIYVGFDPRRLHLLVVRDEKREGHAVLGVDVHDKGFWNTLVLDNKHDVVITLEEMEKKYEGTLASFVMQLNDGSRRTKFFKYAVKKGT